jgi:beta-lactam-binding protein with PASTA domain
VGLRTGRAQAALSRAGLASAVERKASARPVGTVLAAKPKPGSRVERGVAILLVVSGRPRHRGGGTTATTTTTTMTTTTTKTATTTTGTAPAPTGTTPTVTGRPSDPVIVKPEPAPAVVPGVLNVGFVDSTRKVEDIGLVAATYPVASSRPRGMVIRQRPEAGTRLAKGRTVRLYVAVGRGGRGAASLGDFTGLPERQARELLTRAGFTVRTVDRAAASRKLVGVVMKQQPSAPKKLPVLSQVVLYVGR